MDCGGDMNKFYRKPKPETMKKNRDVARVEFPDEIKWLKEHLGKLGTYKHKFLLDMYSFLIKPKKFEDHMKFNYFTSKKIISDEKLIYYLRNKNNIFDAVYNTHYVRNTNDFILMDTLNSMCQSWLMYLYH